MLEGIKGLKLVEENSYYELNDIGLIISFIGIVLFFAGLLLIENSYEETWNTICGIVAIIGLSLVINGVIFGRKEYKEYTFMPIEENYCIDLDKYAIDNEESNNNLIVIREKYESEED